jgi:hypothetical protein
VAVFDTGYDDGTGITGSHHPDLETPDRLVDVGNYMFTPTTQATEDHRGHGTMVAGIIAGDGTRSGTRDAQGFYLGTGIAPDARLVAVQVMDNTASCVPRQIFGYPPTQIGSAISFARVNASGGDKALIGNHSWNVAARRYDAIARLFDERVIDGDSSVAGAQAMTMIVAAGNDGSEGTNTVASPATAKNVIAVGATQSYRPSLESGAPPNQCDPSVPATLTQEANNVAAVSAFSSRGPEFTRGGQGTKQAHLIRIKPDLVAPGGRVFSTVPYQAEVTYTCGNLCRRYWPASDYHSYSSGTSFAAPVVSGVAALARKWFLDRGTSPSPSLLKAALIATATDLGPASGGDYRPSHKFGWGRIDLNRLTDSSVARFYANENAGFALITGAEKSWTRTIDNPAKPVFMTLVWSDPPSPDSSGYPPLINDLRLSVELVGGNSAWHGNNFEENFGSTENGYSHHYNKAAASKVDSINTVESVFIPANTFSPGAKIIVRVKGTTVSTVAGQKFSVYAYNVRFGS